MPLHGTTCLIGLYEKATQHIQEFHRLSKDLTTQSEALEHLSEVERLHSQIRKIIQEVKATTVQIG